MPYRAKPIFTYSAYNSTGVSASNLIKLGVSDIQRKFKIQDINQYKFEQIRPYLLQVIDNSPENFTVITKANGIPYEIRLNSRISMTEIKDKKTDLFLTKKQADLISKSKILDSLKRTYNEIKSYNTSYFPNDIRYNWNEDNFGPIIIPEKNKTVELNKNNLPIYKKIIRDYEKNELTLDLNGTIHINNIETSNYTFKQDYYWMMGDNRYKSEDSRSWGFVPEDHIVGKPVFIWFSIDGINDGIKNWKIRWDRVFTTINLDGEPKSYRWYFLFGVLCVLIYSEIKKRRK
jgi:signal peptidase I